MEQLEAIELAKAFGLLTAEEVHGIRFLAALIPDGALCMNIGAGTGTSALAFIEARPELAKNFWTIDIEVETPFGGLQNEKNSFAKTRFQLPNHILHDSNTVDYPTYMNIEKPVFDYVFIDGNHSFQSCTNDFYNIFKFCKSGTIVAFHDYGRSYDKNTVMVKPAVDAIIEKTGAEIILHIGTLLAIRLK